MSAPAADMTVPPIPRRVPELWQPRHPVFWLATVLVFVFGALIVISLASAVDEPLAALAAVVLCSAQVVVLWLIVRAMPRFRRQSASLMILAAVWGGVVAPGVAMLAGSGAQELIWTYGLESLSAALSAPVNEDLMRLLGVLAVLTLASRRTLTVMDGAVYGFVVGAGFEVVENLLYALRGESFGETLSVGIMRLLVGFGLHALWTTVAGAGLAYCLSRRQRGLSSRWWVLVPAVLSPMLLHAGWDAPSPSVFPFFKLLLLAVLYAVTIVLFVIAVRWGRRDEFRWYLERIPSAIPLVQLRALPRAQRRVIAAAAVAEERNGVQSALGS